MAGFNEIRNACDGPDDLLFVVEKLQDHRKIPRQVHERGTVHHARAPLALDAADHGYASHADLVVKEL